MEWKVFIMEWKKIASMEYGKSSSIPFHTMPCKYVYKYINFEIGYDKGHSQEIPKPIVLKPLFWRA